MSAFRVASAPNTSVVDRVSQANSMRELIELLPVNVRHQLGSLCEEAYSVSHKRATIQAAVADLKACQAKKSPPRTIAVRPYKVQSTKEFAGSGAQRQGSSKLDQLAKAYALSIVDATLEIKEAELDHLGKLLDPAKWKSQVLAIGESARTRLGLSSAEAPAQLAATPSSSQTGQEKVSESIAFLEHGWEKALPSFIMRAIALGDASVQRELSIKLKKLTLFSEKKAEAKADAMEIDSTTAAAPAASSSTNTSATIQQVVSKQVDAAFKRLEGLIKSQNAPKGAKNESKSPHNGLYLTHTNSPQPRRKKEKGSGFREASIAPGWRSKTKREREGEEETDAGVWEEVREFKRQKRNLSLKGDHDGIPDMYLDMSEQARKIYSFSELRMNEIQGVGVATIFISPNAYVPADVERFLSLNGKFCLHAPSPPDDLTLLEQWNTVMDRALWSFYFRNSAKGPLVDPDLYVKTHAMIPEGIDDRIWEGLDAGASELLEQAAAARRHWTDVVNPGIAPMRQYLAVNQLIVKPTDKNLGLAVFTAQEYAPAVAKLLSDGPYESAPAAVSSAIDLHDKLVKRIPKGLTNTELKFIREHRTIAWPQFHAIPKVHKHPWSWRPIVPAHSSPTTRMSKVADLALTPMLLRFPHLIRSTAEWVRAFHEGLNKRSGKRLWFVTGDVVAYYTNIDIDTVDGAMEALLRGARVPGERAKAIAHLVRTVTHNNYFVFNDKLLRQTNGLAMGSPCSGTVANLSLARREKRLLGLPGLLAYTRYIDDVFALIEGTEQEVRFLLSQVTDAAKPLQIKWEISERHAVYLDVQVSSEAFGINVEYRPFRKPGNQHAYLPWSSAHPDHVKKGLVIGETTRLALLCSEERLFKEEVVRLRDLLVRRGYPGKALVAWTLRVPWHRRFASLDKKDNSPDSTPLVLRIPSTYNPLWKDINLKKVFDKMLDHWAEAWEPQTRPTALSLSQRRGENLMNLLSSWNKSVLGQCSDADEEPGF